MTSPVTTENRFLLCPPKVHQIVDLDFRDGNWNGARTFAVFDLGNARNLPQRPKSLSG
jgi:hypothetical protein